MLHQYRNIPALLKLRPCWVVWGIQGAPPKAPYNPASLLTGRQLTAKAGIKESWGNFQTAVECVDRGLAQGIGFEFEGNELYGVDLDHVIDSNGALTTEAHSIVSYLNSYTEVSPSGAGLHIFVLAPDANITRHRKKDHFLEVYNEGRYFTVTGNTYGSNKNIENRTQELQSIHDRLLLTSAVVQKTAGSPHSLPVSGITDDKFLKIGSERDKAFAALWNGDRRHGNESSDDIALMNKLAYWCSADPDAMLQAFLSSPYYSQKDEAHIKKCQRNDYLPRTASNSCSTIYSTAAADYERFNSKRKTGRQYER